MCSYFFLRMAGKKYMERLKFYEINKKCEPTGTHLPYMSRFAVPPTPKNGFSWKLRNYSINLNNLVLKPFPNFSLPNSKGFSSIFHLVLKKKWNKHTQYRKNVCPHSGPNYELRPCGARNKEKTSKSFFVCLSVCQHFRFSFFLEK